jgi:predicted O-linked N-acetylglucosamine transferase (SPINDLY family)
MTAADHWLAVAHQAHRAGDDVAARTAYRAAIAIEPDFFAPYGSLGSLLLGRHDAERAAGILARARRLAPAEPTLTLQCATLAQQRRRWAEAEALYRHLLILQPDRLEGWFSLPGALLALDRFDSALTAARRAVRLAPLLAVTRYNLGDACLARGREGEAADQLTAALALDPAHGGALGDFANLAVARGRHRAADVWHARMLALEPANAVAWSNRLFAAMSDPALSDEAVRAIAESRATPAPPRPRRQAGKRLRIGYVSPDFRQHACAQFLLPLLSAHDRDRVEIVAYAEMRGPDAVTERFRRLADRWRETNPLTDTALADLIRADGIDVLVDLAGHSGGNRLGAFALRPAPVQVSWLGFNATTGLAAIDWRLTDPWLSPPGSESGFTEALWRLDRPAHCWRPPIDAPPVAERAGPLVFGSFNNLSKLSPATIALWSRLLTALPEARLLLKAPSSGEPGTQSRIAAAFAATGTAPDRVVFAPWSTNPADHLARYAEVDVALDPLPYNGTTTSCEALWMGVPVVTRTGTRMIGRVGFSLLANVGLGHLVAPDDDGYVAIARDLARDRAGLQRLRQGMRERLAASALCDESGFAGAVERAFAAMRRAAS